ncbi:MAG: response regulator [Pirellulaceae bacterium]
MQTSAAPQFDPVLAPAPRRHSILIVDDDQDQVTVLDQRLRGQGYDTLLAHTGGSGAEIARKQRPSLVVLDVRLPDTDGFSVCARLADAPETCAIPVILLSGMERPDIIRRARAVGSQFYVRKPYDPNALLILIQNAIREAETW